MINPAFAQTAAQQPSMLASFIPLILIFLIFYFLLIRPQQKRVKEHKLMVQNLKRGNTIVSAGGIIGKIVKAVDGSEDITVEISKGVNVEISRQMVSELRNKK